VKKLLLVAAPLLALIIFAPLAVAVVVVSILAPAAVNAIDCGANVPAAATGEWRPPFQQRYVLTSAFGRRFHPIYKEWQLHTGDSASGRRAPWRVRPRGMAPSSCIVEWHRQWHRVLTDQLTL
jgi:hypothetical protein